MPTADHLAPLEELPQLTRELARATIRSGRSLISASVAEIGSEPRRLQTLLAIRRTALQLHFFIARSREEIIFFFYKKQLATIRPLEARLQLSMQARQELPAAPTPLPAAAGSARLISQVCSYRVLIPPFLKVRPTTEELALYAPAGTTADNGILFFTGPAGRHVLAIRNPEAENRAAVVYTTKIRQPLTGWPAEPFLELIETLRAWLASSQPANQEVGLELPTDPSAMTDVHATLYWFVEAYRSLEAEQKAAAEPALTPALAGLMPSYSTEDYTADISLCVDRTGRFATPKDRQPVSLTMHLEVRREQTALVTRITLSPPDFLAGGSLRATFLEVLRSSTSSATLKAIGMPQDGWADFLTSAAERAVVLRTNRDQGTDTDVVVLPGIWQSRARTLILQLIAKVDMQAQPISVRISGVTLRYDSQFSKNALLDDNTVTYFMRLALAFKDWLAVLR